VTNYEINTGILLLEHAYPIDIHQVPAVKVDINLILESANSLDLQTGAWLNVIGYVVRQSPKLWEPPRLNSDAPKLGLNMVQALVIWSAGALRIGDYERTLLLHQQTAKEA
jgi:Telomere capping, CST complex subunit